MARFYRCDRCGNEATQPVGWRGVSTHPVPVYQGINMAQQLNQVAVAQYAGCQSPTEICASCVDALNQFLATRPPAAG